MSMYKYTSVYFPSSDIDACMARVVLDEKTFTAELSNPCISIFRFVCQQFIFTRHRFK